MNKNKGLVHDYGRRGKTNFSNRDAKQQIGEKQMDAQKYFIPAMILGMIVVLGGWYFLTYNSLIGADQNVNEKWAQVETQYQRRVDLIPNLVATVQGGANFEKGTLEDITRLRSQWQTQTSQAQRVETANQLETTISKLLLVSENYPQLTATQGFQDLLVQLEGTENRVAFARNEFNTAVRDYNVRLKAIPGNFIASSMGLSEKKFFDAAAGAENAPKVNFPA